MRVYRLSKAIYALDLTGKGAEKAGGRWNSKGIAMVYTGESRALCTAEIAVHTPLGYLPEGFSLVTIEIPDEISLVFLKPEELAKDWKIFPHPHSTQKIGDRFIRESKFAVLKVPSVVVQGEFNYLINPGYPDAPKIRIINTEPFEFDVRFFKR